MPPTPPPEYLGTWEFSITAGKVLLTLLRQKSSHWARLMEMPWGGPHSLIKCITQSTADLVPASTPLSWNHALLTSSNFYPVHGPHAALWHPLGHLSSESGDQQGDPLSPLFFLALVIKRIIYVVDMDDQCIELSLWLIWMINALNYLCGWYGWSMHWDAFQHISSGELAWRPDWKSFSCPSLVLHNCHHPCDHQCTFSDHGQS